jgi:uncharacterized CHY-type Zn-finger protein
MRKSSLDKHNMTAKHIKTTNNNAKVATSCTKYYSCNNCDKDFNDRTGLWRHKKKCQTNNVDVVDVIDIIEEPIEINTCSSDNDIIMLLIKENSELKSLMMEVIKNGTHNVINNHNINSNNKTFNLQFFLHETCKDAMNIMDFVDSIKLQLTDLEKVGNIGYVEGISNIITTNLKALDVTQRPIHCTDNKREILYVKDEDKWEKENDEKKKLRKVIKHIANKNSKLILEFKNTYPDCVKSHSIKSDQYNKLIIEAMGGLGDNDLEKEDKIIKKITKEVIIDKYI